MLAKALNIDASEVYLGSTGSIGYPLPIDDILLNIDKLAGARTASASAAEEFVRATMTTDTRPKQASVSYFHEGKEINIAASVKGAGMVMPNMATMLCTVITSINISREMLYSALVDAVDKSFHCVTVDGDTSTNDSVFVLANGIAKNPKIIRKDAAYDLFRLHLVMLLEHLAIEMIRDGEGITKFIAIHIHGVPSKDKGRAIAFSIANSPLVKTALFGEQMNWGRVMMAAGKAYTGLDFGLIDMAVNSIQILKSSEVVSSEALQQAKESLRKHDIVLELDFKQGEEQFTAWTCDFSYDYVKINAGYLS